MKRTDEKKFCSTPHTVEQAAVALREQNKRQIPSDVDGSYTGESREGDEPVQDADDL